MEHDPDPSSQTGGLKFLLPAGDRTTVQLVDKKGENEDHQPAHDPPKTLYKVAKELQAKHGGADLVISGHGRLISHMDAPGSHGYCLEFPPGHQKCEPMRYSLKGDATGVSSGNVFRVIAAAESYEGYVALMWRLAFNDVKKQLGPRKPMLLTTKEIAIEKGMAELIGKAIMMASTLPKDGVVKAARWLLMLQ